MISHSPGNPTPHNARALLGIIRQSRADPGVIPA
jgi:hypothetical protein